MTETEKSTVTKAQVRYAIGEDVVNGNGHDLYDSKMYTELGFDCEHLCQTHTSDVKASWGSKAVIFDDEGNALKEVRGISSLDFHVWLADTCGLEQGADYAPQMGRGSRARVIRDALETWANSPDKESLLAGDEVFWSDPDDGKCSGHGVFVKNLNDEVAIIKKDDVEIEVFVKELS